MIEKFGLYAKSKKKKSKDFGNAKTSGALAARDGIGFYLEVFYT